MKTALTKKKLRNWVGNSQIVAEELIDGAARTTDRIRRRMNPSPLRTVLLSAGAAAAAAGLAYAGYQAVKTYVLVPREEDLEDDLQDPDGRDESVQESAQVH